MDIESANLPPICHASEEDLLGVLAADFGATLTLLRNIATELAGPGTFTSFTMQTIPYAEWNRLMAVRSRDSGAKSYMGT